MKTAIERLKQLEDIETMLTELYSSVGASTFNATFYDVFKALAPLRSQLQYKAWEEKRDDNRGKETPLEKGTRIHKAVEKELQADLFSNPPQRRVVHVSDYVLNYLGTGTPHGAPPKFMCGAPYEKDGVLTGLQLASLRQTAMQGAPLPRVGCIVCEASLKQTLFTYGYRAFNRSRVDLPVGEFTHQTRGSWQYLNYGELQKIPKGRRPSCDVTAKLRTAESKSKVVVMGYHNAKAFLDAVKEQRDYASCPTCPWCVNDITQSVQVMAARLEQ